MRLSAAVAATAFALGALPGSSASASAVETLPRLALNDHVLQQSQRLVVRGTRCEPTGLEPGYSAHLEAASGQAREPDVWPEAAQDGTWKAEHVLATVPANRYEIRSTCYRGRHPNDPAYPVEVVTVLPDPSGPLHGRLTVAPGAAMAGSALRVSGSGFSPSRAVGVFWGSTFLGSLAGESVSGTVHVPRDAKPGVYRLLAQGLAPAVDDEVLRTLVAEVYVGAVPAPQRRPRSTTPPPPAPKRATPSPTAVPAKAATVAPVARPATKSPTPSPTTAAPVPEAPPAAPPEAAPPVVPASGRSPLLPVGAGVLVVAAGAASFLAWRRRAPRAGGAGEAA